VRLEPLEPEPWIVGDAVFPAIISDAATRLLDVRHGEQVATHESRRDTTKRLVEVER